MADLILSTFCRGDDMNLGKVDVKDLQSQEVNNFVGEEGNEDHIV